MIVRQIANTHGWSVSAENSDHGGAEFRFTHIQQHDTEQGSQPTSETD
jgi:signal transduction histidine kinase